MLQRHRQAAGLSQEELAERAGLSRRGISDLERGVRRAPYPATVRLLAEALSLAQPEQVALLAASRLGGAASGDPAAARPRSTLPMTLSSFVGREREVAEVQRLLETSRLLTLVGAGGIGKTRLAIEAARGDPEAAFVDLAPLTEGRLVAAAIAAALGIDERPRVAWVDLLTTNLVARRLLLVLDNCEHLTAACAEVTDRLLGACPRVRILATSREPLAIAGEQLWPVLPLATTTSVACGPDVLPAAIRLFVARARLVQPEFALDDQATRSVTAICRHLDGVPLAIELAAARIRVLGLEGLRTRLDERLRLFKSTTHGVPVRHQSLGAAIAWSYDLLSEAEQSVFGSLSAFAGSWTCEAAEVVCADERVAADAVLDLLERLVDRSLVHAMPDAIGTVRYRLLETVRQFARERLQAGGAGHAVLRRHAEYYVHLAEGAARDFRGANQVRVVGLLELEHENLRAALHWSITRREAELGLRLGTALWQFWLLHGHVSEGREWLAQVLGLPTAGMGSATRAQARAEALGGAGFLALRQGDFAVARALFEESLAIRRELGDRAGVAMCLNDLGVLTDDEGDYASAICLHEQSLAIRRELGDPLRIAASLSNLGAALMHRAIVNSLTGRRIIEEQRREYALARRMLEEALAIRREFADVQWLAGTLINLGFLADFQDDYPTARIAHAESLAISRELGDQDCTGWALEGFSALAAAQGQAVRALRLDGAAARLRERLGTLLPFAERAVRQHRLARIRHAVGAGAAHAAWAEGYALSVEQAIADALEQAPPS